MVIFTKRCLLCDVYNLETTSLTSVMVLMSLIFYFLRSRCISPCQFICVMDSDVIIWNDTCNCCRIVITYAASGGYGDSDGEDDG